MSAEEQAPWRAKAEAAKKEHATKYPNYKFEPGSRASNQKKSRSKAGKCDRRGSSKRAKMIAKVITADLQPTSVQDSRPSPSCKYDAVTDL